MATVLNGCLAALLTALPGWAQAQDSDGEFYEGRWSAKLEDSEAGYRSARVKFQGFGGTWQDTSVASKLRNRACAGKTFPITVQRSRTTDLEFVVWGSSVSPHCPDLSVLLKPLDPKTLEGTIGSAGKLRLSRR